MPQLHCVNMFPPVGKNVSALWGIHELPGVCLHRYMSTSSQPGWRVESWVDDEATELSRNVVSQLYGQVFHTRREALEAVSLIMDLAE